MSGNIQEGNTDSQNMSDSRTKGKRETDNKLDNGFKCHLHPLTFLFVDYGNLCVFSGGLSEVFWMLFALGKNF